MLENAKGRNAEDATSPYQWVDLTEYREVKNQIARALLQRGVRLSDIQRWSPALADLWQEANEIRRSIESFGHSAEDRPLMSIIMELESMRPEIVEYDRLVKQIWRRVTRSAWRPTRSEIDSIRGMLSASLGKSSLVDDLAESIWRFRNLSDKLTVELSDRELLQLTTRRNRKRTTSVLRNLASDAESAAKSLRSKTDPFAEA